MTKNIKKIAKTIIRANSIALFTHISPDCDALGSVFALYYTLTEMGKTVSIYSKDKFANVENLLFDECVVQKKVCDSNKYDLFISCDAPALFRLGEYAEVFKEKANSIVIDHHQNGGLLGKFNYINKSRSSCCELVLEILEAMKVKISSQVASKLYAGLSSDTNSFANSNTNEQTFNSALKLMRAGAEIGYINECLYQSRTRKSIEFKKFLWNNAKIKGECAYCVISNQELKELKGNKEDCVGFSRSLISIQGVNYSFSIIEEAPGIFNVSLRSKIGYDVLTKAEKLGGGGHLCASGAKIQAKSINEAKKMVLSTFKEVCQ